MLSVACAEHRLSSVSLRLGAIILSVIILSVIRPSVIILIVIRPSVMALANPL